MKRYLILMTAAALVAACSNDADEAENGYVPSDNAIAFDASADDGQTRAPGQINSDANLRGTSFGVFGSYTGALKYENTTVSPDFMYNEKVTYDNGSGKWSYRPVKYWPNDSREYVSFFAYAPYEATPTDDGRCIIDMSKLSDLGDPWINYRMAADPWSASNPQVDLLYGVNATNNSSWLDQQKPSDPVNDKVLFTFHHALSCIGEKITIKCSQALVDLIDGYVTSIKITNVTINYKNLTTKARLVLRCEGSANWKEIISGELTTTRTYTKDLTASPIEFASSNFTTEQTISEGDGLFYIPLRIAGTDAAQAEVTITYTVTNNANQAYSGTASTSFELDMNMEGQKQGIALQLTKNLDLQHLVYTIGTGATGPSYSRQR
jgi:hypothetical protein